MLDPNQLSNEDLMKIASQTQQPDPNSMSNEQLIQIARQSKQLSSDVFSDMSSKAGAFNAAFENIPDKVNYDIGSTVNWLGKKLGLISPQAASKREKELSASLSASEGRGGTSFLTGNSYRQDIKKRPDLFGNVRGVGALGMEMFGTQGLATGIGKAASKVLPYTMNAMEGSALGRVASGTASDIAQGAGLGLLQSGPDNKGMGGVAGGAIGGALGLPLRTAGEVARKFIQNGLTNAELATNLKNADNIERSTKVQLTLGQETGNNALKTLEQKARNAPVFSTDPAFIHQRSSIKNYSDTVMNRFKPADNTRAIDDAAAAVSGYDNSLNSLREQKDYLYNSVNQGMDDAVGATARADTVSDMANKIKQGLKSDPDYKGIPDTLLPDIKNVMERIDSVSTGAILPSQLSRASKDISKMIDNTYKKLGTQTMDDRVAGIFSALKDSLGDDILRTAEQSGHADELIAANNFYKNSYTPFKKIAVKGGDSLQQAQSLSKYLMDPKNNPAKIIKDLSPEAIENLKAYHATQAFESSVNKTNSSLNSQQFFSRLDKTIKNNNLVFNKEDQKLAEGMVKLNQQLGSVSANSPVGGGTEWMLTLWPRLLLTTPGGKALVKKMASLPPGSAGSSMIVNGIFGIVNTARKAMGGVAGNAVEYLETPPSQDMIRNNDRTQ